MFSTRFTKWFIYMLLITSAAVSSCQKDDDGVNDVPAPKTAAVTDSASTMSIINTPGNFLATKGTLTLTIQDSTYTFDAVTDSVAFINMHSGDSKYFGITAINKAHTMSFGISSVGFAAANIDAKVAGSQFLLKPDDKKPLLQYTLSQYLGKDDFGKISIEKYNNNDLIAKGTFFTFLAKDDKANSPFYRAAGTFELHLK